MKKSQTFVMAINTMCLFHSSFQVQLWTLMLLFLETPGLKTIETTQLYLLSGFKSGQLKFIWIFLRMWEPTLSFLAAYAAKSDSNSASSRWWVGSDNQPLLIFPWLPAQHIQPCSTGQTKGTLSTASPNLQEVGFLYLPAIPRHT